MKKKEFVTEYDAILDAFSKVNINEAVAPLYRGKIVEDEETYNKVQQLLDCNDMEHAHKFLLDIDFEDISPETKQKVDDLYSLAVSEGYINNITKNSSNDEDEDVSDEGDILDKDEQSSDYDENEKINDREASLKDSTRINLSTLKTVAFTLFYSAIKDGEIRTGECYSNANTMENAKLDAIQKLRKLGFTAIDIIAAEESDPNSIGVEDFDGIEFGEKTNYDEIKSSDEEDDEESDDEDEFKSDEEESDEEDEEDDEESDEEDESISESIKINEDSEDSKDSEDKKETKDEKKEDEEEYELSRSEKLDYFKRYMEEYKYLLRKNGFESYSEMPLKDRVIFYREMNDIWEGKPDPTTFMSEDNIKKIENMRIKLD